MNKFDELASCVAEFLQFLYKVEESDMGTQFHPNQISSCRVMDHERMVELIKKMKEMVEDKSWLEGDD